MKITLDQSIAEKIHEHLRVQQTEMVERLKSFVAIESPSGDANSQAPAFDFLVQFLSELGFRCRRIPGKETGGQMLAIPQSRSRGCPTQLLLGHCDTVWPTGTLKRMPVESVDGRLHGPGSYDMKGGLVQALFALKTLQELKLEPIVTPVFFVNSDEEIGSPESRQNLHRMARIVDRAFVLEPSLGPRGNLKTGRKGVGRFVVKVIGRSAHAGLDPEKGISAIQEMSHVIQKLHAMNDVASGTTVNVGKISGGTRPNVVPEQCAIEIDVRVLTMKDAKAIEESIAALQPTLDGAQLNISGSVRRPPLESTPRNRILWEAAQQSAEWMGLSIDQATAGGGSDGNWMSQHTATLDGLGAVGDGAHALNEHVVESAMPSRAALLACMLLSPPINHRS